MSWLKSLNYKRFLKIFRQDSAPEKSLFSFVFRWNQTTKVVAGLLASIFSMMALISFFGSLEQQALVDSDQSAGANLAPELGVSDELSLEFGLDASLPTRESESELMEIPDYDTNQSNSMIRAVSVQQAVGTAQDDAGVYHAVGRDYGPQNQNGRVEQIAGERPIFVSPDRQSGSQDRSTGEGAAWLTGEIEAADDVPVDHSFRRLRN